MKTALTKIFLLSCVQVPVGKRTLLFGHKQQWTTLQLEALLSAQLLIAAKNHCQATLEWHVEDDVKLHPVKGRFESAASEHFVSFWEKIIFEATSQKKRKKKNQSIKNSFLQLIWSNYSDRELKMDNKSCICGYECPGVNSMSLKWIKFWAEKLNACQHSCLWQNESISCCLGGCWNELQWKMFLLCLSDALQGKLSVSPTPALQKSGCHQEVGHLSGGKILSMFAKFIFLHILWWQNSWTHHTPQTWRLLWRLACTWFTEVFGCNTKTVCISSKPNYRR